MQTRLDEEFSLGLADAAYNSPLPRNRQVDARLHVPVPVCSGGTASEFQFFEWLTSV